LVAFIAGTIISAPQASAANPVVSLINDQIIPKLNQIIVDIAALQTGVSPTTETQIDNIESDVVDIKTDVGDIKTDVGTIQNNQYVPFHQVLTSGITTCAVAGAGTDFDTLIIDSQATSGTFTVNSIIIRPSATSVNEIQDSIKALLLAIDGGIVGVITPDLTKTTTVTNTFDIMGTPLSVYDGFFPRHITAESAGSNDIEIRLLCNAGTTNDLEFIAIHVSGWKQAGDTISLSYLE